MCIPVRDKQCLQEENVERMYLKLGLVVLDEFVDGEEIDGVKLVIHRTSACPFTHTGVTVVAPDQIIHKSVQ